MPSGYHPPIYIRYALVMNNMLKKLKSKAESVIVDSILYATGLSLIIALPVLSVIVRVNDEENR